MDQVSTGDSLPIKFNELLEVGLQLYLPMLTPHNGFIVTSPWNQCLQHDIQYTYL